MEISDKKRVLINTAIIFLYAVLTLITVFHHEIWRDEAQAWLVTRDLNFFGLISHVRTEGHPLLWYFSILPFAKLLKGFNAVFSMQLLNWAIVTAGMSVFVFKSPFNTFCKTSVLASSGFFYWYPVIARSYCFIPILVFLLAILYPKQKEHPFWYAAMLIALANTHIIMFGFCCALAFLFVIQSKDKKHIAAASFVIIGLISVVLYLWGSQNDNYVVRTSLEPFTLQKITDIFQKTVMNLDSYVNWFNTSIFSIFLVFCGSIFYIKNKKIFFVYISNLVFQYFIYLFVWSILLPQRAYTLLIVPIFCFWILYKELDSKKLKVSINIILILIFLLSFPNAIYLTKNDFTKEFSNGKNAAQFIKNNIQPDAFIVSNYAQTTAAVSAYLPKDKWRFWYDPYNDYYTYTIWKKPLPPSCTPVPVRKLLQEREEMYIILSGFSKYEDIKPVYAPNNEVMVNFETILIYKLKKVKKK